MSAEVQGVRYTVDIVMCIDTTGSMGGLIDKVKASALRFNQDLNVLLDEKNKVVDDLRVKVIAFRDFYVDGDQAMQTSPFFGLPEEREAFATFVGRLRADGGGDEPENGLEALSLAIKSDWARSSGKRRQIVVMWTDASCHAFDKNAGVKPSNYPNDMPRDFDELTDWWQGQSYVSNTAKRLLMFAPDAYPWTDIANHWDNSLHYPSKAGDGLSDVDYSAILSAIENSI